MALSKYFNPVDLNYDANKQMDDIINPQQFSMPENPSQDAQAQMAQPPQDITSQPDYNQQLLAYLKNAGNQYSQNKDDYDANKINPEQLKAQSDRNSNNSFAALMGQAGALMGSHNGKVSDSSALDNYSKQVASQGQQDLQNRGALAAQNKQDMAQSMGAMQKFGELDPNSPGAKYLNELLQKYGAPNAQGQNATQMHDVLPTVSKAYESEQAQKAAQQNLAQTQAFQHGETEMKEQHDFDKQSKLFKQQYGLMATKDKEAEARQDAKDVKAKTAKDRSTLDNMAKEIRSPGSDVGKIQESLDKSEKMLADVNGGKIGQGLLAVDTITSRVNRVNERELKDADLSGLKDRVLNLLHKSGTGHPSKEAIRAYGEFATGMKNFYETKKSELYRARAQQVQDSTEGRIDAGTALKHFDPLNSLSPKTDSGGGPSLNSIPEWKPK